VSAPALLAYPSPPHDATLDVYHGTTVADPYRPLEELDAPETAAWVAAQNALTQAYLAEVPQRAAIHARLTSLWNYERRGAPERVGDRYAYFRNTGLQNQAVLELSRDLAEPGRVLLDPNTLSEDGTVALSGLAFSDDGRRLAYATSVSGSDWMEWRVRDVDTGADLADIVRWSKFTTAAWRTDGSGFYYGRYDEPKAGAAAFKDANLGHRIFFHRLGTPQSTDVLVYERPDHPDWTLGVDTSADGNFLIISASRGTESENRLFVADLRVGATVMPVFDEAEARWEYLGNDDTTFYFLTSKDAPRGRIVAFDLRERTLREVVAETSDALDGASLFGDTVIAWYLHDARSRVVRAPLAGGESVEIALPGLGTVGGFDGRRGAAETFYSYTSATEPSSLYRLDLASGATERVFAPRLSFDGSAFVSEQVFCTSKDGTRVPMMLTYRRGIARDGSAPTILYGYGGFDISMTPAFSSAVAVWLEMGGVWAVANLRGGGEYGEEWHRDGMAEKKQNVFDDCFACAEWLIAEKRTSTPRLALMGGSNGGLLVGACMTQRPELFGAALPAVGVLDMLRFQKFTIGWAWTSEYGSSDEPEHFANLHGYSPLHNIKPGAHYPATMIFTGDHDDRVFPGHSFKFAAALQSVMADAANPVLLRVDVKAGHGAGKPTAKLIDEAADRYAFLVRALNFSPEI
jgi:prolyl oligopeptidase